MANTVNSSVSLVASINGLNVNQAGSVSSIPTGSVAFGESVLIPTGSWTQVFTGSTQTIGTIAFFNTAPSGSLTVVASGSGAANNLGNIQPIGASNNAGTIIQWNNPLTGLYAQAYNTSSYGVFIVLTN